MVNLSLVDSLLRLVDRELWIVTAAHEGARAGLTATWISQVSLDPQQPCLLAGLAPNHATTQVVLASGMFGLHLLAKGQIDLAYRFASSSSAKVDKFAGCKLVENELGVPQIAGSVAWFACRTVAKVDAGDRMFLWGDVVAAEGDIGGMPLRQSEFFAALSEAEKDVLRSDRTCDIQLQREGREFWRRKQERDGLTGGAEL